MARTETTLSRNRLDGAAAAALRRAVRGPVLLPGDDGFDDERVGYQTALAHRPDLLVGATGAEDVRAAVGFAAARGLPVAVQATGHGMPLPVQGGVLISTRRMTGVTLDAAARTARVAAGATWQDVVDVAAPHGLAPLSGSAPHVGAVSYTLGGGLGLLARQYGYAADHVRAIEVVTADAELRRVDADHGADLFRALLGGRGTFGVATEIEIGLLEVRSLYGGGLFFDGRLAPRLLRAYREWTGGQPEAMTSSIAVVPFPDAPRLPEPIRGRHAVHVRIAYNGSAEDGERLVAPLRAAGPVLLDGLETVPFSRSGTIYNDPTAAMAYYSSNACVHLLDPQMLGSVLDLVGPGGDLPGVLEVRHLGGALGRPGPGTIGHRSAEFLVSVLTRLGEPELDEVRGLHARLGELWGPWSLGTSLNFLYGERADIEQVRRAFDPDDYRRLRELKARFDPDNVFRGTHNIPPAG